MKYRPSLRSLAPAVIVTAVVLAGCSSTQPPPAARASAPAPVAAPAPVVQAPPVQAAQPAAAQPRTSQLSSSGMVIKTSNAIDPRAYRKDAASHIYGHNKERIYKGRMPPLLYAIGVLQVEVDGNGQVRNLSWMRAPNHAPEVVAEIEKTVRAAAPFPVPAKMGKVVYTDTWLWHKSGRFQLDTLTEGQD